MKDFQYNIKDENSLSSYFNTGMKYYGRKEVKRKMAKLDLTQYGITGTTEIVHNPSYETLFEEETKPGLEGYEADKKVNLEQLTL